MTIQIKNALITDVSLRIESPGILTAWLILQYEDGVQQGFGGYILDMKYDGPELRRIGKEFGTTFIIECLRIADVDSWTDIKGKTIRVQYLESSETIVAIGHIIKDIWFNPRAICNLIKERAEYHKSSLDKLKIKDIEKIVDSSRKALTILADNYYDKIGVILQKLDEAKGQIYQVAVPEKIEQNLDSIEQEKNASEKKLINIIDCITWHIGDLERIPNLSINTYAAIKMLYSIKHKIEEVLDK